MVRSRLFAVVWTLMAICLALSGCSSNGSDDAGRGDEQPEETSTVASPIGIEAPVSIPQFEIIDEETHDSPIKAQVVFRAVVTGDVTESGLRALLQKLYDDAMEKSGFQYHARTTHVFAYVYTSEEHAVSGYQWVAMLEKTAATPGPKVSIDESRLEMYLNPPEPESRFGMTESQRREIFKDIVRTESRARREATARYPDLSPVDPGYSQDAFMEQLDTQMDEQDRLTEIYKNDLAEEHDLTRAELREITQEGMRMQWPMPEFEG